MKSPRRRPPRTAMTLAEITVATALVGIVLVTALQTSAFVSRNRSRIARQMQGPVLADSLLSEILALPLLDPETGATALGREPGETDFDRSQFDDVGDYHGWTASPPETPPGDSVPGADGWSRSVSVEFFDPEQLTPTTAETALYRVTVTAQAPDGERFTAVGLATDQGPRDPSGTPSTAVMHWFQLEMVQNGKTVSSSAGSRNLLTDDGNTFPTE